MALKNYQYDQIMRSYDSLRLKNRHELEKRKKLVYQSIPELSDIDSLIAEGSVACAKAVLFSDSSALAALEKSNLDLSNKKKSLLLKHGYPEEYLSMQYHCDLCKDMGYIENQKCHCFKQSIVDLIYSQSGVKDIIKHENFKTFSYEYYRDDYINESTNLTPLENMKRVVHHAKQFIDSFDDSFQNLLIMGNTGVGKTFLTNCIASDLMDQGHIVIYLTSFRFFQIMEEYKFNRKEENYEFLKDQFDYIFDCDLLIIDDLGTEMNNTFISSQLYQVINERYLRQKSTIISTNLSFNQLEGNYSERTSSRIMSCYKLLKIVGEDIRIKKLIV